VNYVSFWDAARFANWIQNGQPTGAQGPGTTEAGAYVNIGNQATFARQAGARFYIPTEDEWYKAAYDNKNAGVAADYFDYPTGSNATPINSLPDTGNHVNFEGDDGNSTTGAPYYRTEVGAFGQSASPYGTFDQGGNVWEWNETAIGPERGLRGGSFYDESDFVRALSRSLNTPELSFRDVGFRIAAAVPEPSTKVLAVVACGSMLWLRRRYIA
jgi:formylglycine-generating enzyme required for sulfatase activity